MSRLEACCRYCSIHLIAILDDGYELCDTNALATAHHPGWQVCWSPGITERHDESKQKMRRISPQAGPARANWLGSVFQLTHHILAAISKLL